MLTAGDGIDASVQADERGGVVMFSREAEDAIQAVVSAVRDVEAAGIKVTGVVEDRVVAAEIAEKAKVTAASVRYWIAGERGPGNFPEPVVRRSGPACIPGLRWQRGSRGPSWATWITSRPRPRRPA